jgi:hypothetical protein
MSARVWGMVIALAAPEAVIAAIDQVPTAIGVS